MVNYFIKKKIKCPYILQNILEYLVYPQPFLNENTKEEIYEKSKRMILKKCFIRNIDSLDKYDIEVVVYKDFCKIVDIGYTNTFDAPWILHIYFDD